MGTMGIRNKIAAWGLPLLISSIGFTQAFAQDGESENPRNADLLRAQEWVLIERSLHPRDARSALMKLEGMRRNTALTMSDAEFYLAIASVTATADNGHSNLSLSPIYNEFGVVPLRAYWFEDGLYITRAEKSHGHLSGGRIVAIEGLELEAMLDKIDPYHGGTRGFMKAYTALSFMMSLPVLEAMGVVTDGALTLTIETKEGHTMTADFGPEHMRKDVGRIWPWQQLAAGTEGEALDWVGIEPTAEETALWLKEPDQSFRTMRLSDDTIYIQFRANFPLGGQDIRAFMAKVTKDLEGNPAKAIILDNRGNIGGDLTLTAAFSLALPDHLEEGGMIYALTDNATFSAGIYNAMTPKGAAPDKSLNIGQHVGDRAAFWAESWNSFQLRQTGWYLNFSLQKHDIGAGCNDEMICHLAGRGAMNIAVGSIAPDHLVPLTYADWQAGKDPVLEKALALANGGE
jgi:hypothetical protein